MPPKDVGEKYKQHDLRSHIYELPDTYVGSAESTTIDTFVYDDDTKHMVRRPITYVPALYKLLDEGVVNALDQAVRLKAEAASGREDVRFVREIRISADRATGAISIYNSGNGIECVKHPSLGVYVAEMIFGMLLTSANYDQNEERVTGGRNGAGVKLVNIFSEQFDLETVDHYEGKIYRQRWHSNMKVREDPVIKSTTKAPYTRITFTPDYARFGLAGMTEDFFQMIRKRAMDAAACTDATVSVYFNDEKIPCKSFESYVDLFLGPKTEHPRVYEACNDRWEVVATYSDGGSFEQVSFVNGINTLRGGRHVDHITGQIVKGIQELVAKKKKKEVKAQLIRDNLMVFVKATIVNPAFDSQTKETFTSPVAKWGSKCELSQAFIDKLYKTDLTEKVVSISEFHDKKKLAKTDGKKTNRIFIPKLEDAHYAGTKNSAEATLILTEGDSAKSMAVSGLSVIGRERYGVFPLRGKILSVKDTPTAKIGANEEIAALKKIIGLEQGKVYQDLSSLRYGRIMIMTDQDSVTGDTPLLLRDPDGFIHIRTIDAIAASDWIMTSNGKEYATTDFTVWTDNGWTSIVKVIRHKCEKRIYRMVTHTGVVDVTEDHSMLRPDGTEVAPRDLKIGEELLHSFPVFPENVPDIPTNLHQLCKKPDLETLASQCKIRYYQQKSRNELVAALEAIRDQPVLELNPPIFAINEDEAYAMGLFWADGSCDVYEWEYTYKHTNRPKAYTHNRTSICWNISNTNLAFLEKAKACMEKRYAFEFKIIDDRYSASRRPQCANAYKLIINGGEKTRDLVEWYRELFYDKDAKKRIPMEILNASATVRQKFFDGFYDGDGAKTMKSGSKSFDVDGKIGAMGMYYLCKSIGYMVSVNIRTDKPKVYILTLTPKDGHQQANPFMIKKIVDMGTIEQYVYDLETENHHFHAGVGQLIVHNTDGYHIRGLLMSLFQTLWPSLFHKSGFLVSMLTPIVKANHRARGETLSFYNLPDFYRWQRETDQRGWTLKYYKGLGTSTSEEAKEYFRQMKLLTYEYTGKESDEAIDLAFSKKRADDRKAWLMQFNADRTLDYNKGKIPYEDFIHEELIHFSNADIERSIPNIMDGLKVSLRKILFTCFKRKLWTNEIRVAQLAGSVSEVSAYHHGEASLQGAIISMAQTFVGANNAPLLAANGQYGGRLQGGSDAASPRYIHTLLTPIARALFVLEDEAVLRFQDDDGLPVEPTWYAPVVPLVLLNGIIGIGTGFSTTIPAFHPAEVVAQCRMIADAVEHSVGDVDSDDTAARAYDAIVGTRLAQLRPFYLGFQGRVLSNGDTGFSSHGVYQWVDDQTVEITELPLFVWTDDYKAFLEETIQAGSTVLKDYANFSTEKTVRFVLKLYPGARAKAEKDFEKAFKLVSTKNLSVNNMHLYTAEGTIKKYVSTEEIIQDWALVRIAKYRERKAHQIREMEHEHKILSAKVRFIQEVIAKVIVVNNAKKSELEEVLRKREYPRMRESGPEDAPAAPGTGAGSESDPYGYLLRMPIYQLTYERKIALEKEADNLFTTIQALRAKTVSQIWREDLARFEEAWDAHSAQVLAEMESDRTGRPMPGNGTRKRAPAPRKKQ